MIKKWMFDNNENRLGERKKRGVVLNVYKRRKYKLYK